MARNEENRRSGPKGGRINGTDAPSKPRREFLDVDTDEEDFPQQGSPECREELAPEPQRPSYEEEQLNTLVGYVKDLLPNAGESEWPEECDRMIREFFENPHHTTISVFRDSTARWKVTLGPPDPPLPPQGFIYFSRSTHWQTYTPKNFLRTVLFGSMSADFPRCIMRIMENTYEPCAAQHEEFSQTGKTVRLGKLYGALHEFLAGLKKRVYASRGLAVLHVPRECGGRKAALATEEGGATERLENVVRRWIGEMNQAQLNSNNHGTVNDQLRRWKAKHSALARIRHQLNDPWLRMIIETLEQLQRPIVPTFRNSVERLDDRLSESSLNLRYLAILHDEFTQSFDLLHGTDYFARRTLLLVLAVCAESPYRSNFAEHVEGLCRALASQMIEQCRRYIKLDAIFAGDARTGINAVERCISCCDTFETTYRDLKARALAEIQPYASSSSSSSSSSNYRQLNDTTVFQHLHTFVERCYDLLYVCDAILVFGGCGKVGKTFPSTNGTTYEARCRQIESTFHKNLAKVIKVQEDILDVTKSKWLKINLRFRNAMKRIEKMAANLLDVSFGNAKTVEEGVKALHALETFKCRKYVNDLHREKYIRIWQIFDKEIENAQAKETYVDETPAVFRCNGTIHHLKINQRYLRATQAVMMDSVDWLADSPAALHIPLTILRESAVHGTT